MPKMRKNEDHADRLIRLEQSARTKQERCCQQEEIIASQVLESIKKYGA
jgi:hypothetical protein